MAEPPFPGSDEYPPAPPPGSLPSRSFGAPREATVPRMEHVRITAPDLARRAALEKTRARLVFASFAFGGLFALLAGKLAVATIIHPVHPKEAAVVEQKVPDPAALARQDQPTVADVPHRASIVDRNGQPLAVSLVTAEVYADPREMIDTADAAHKLKGVLPELNEPELAQRLASAKAFVYVARRITPRQELAINGLGIPGIYFEPSERRSYPLGRVAAQVLGGVDVDGHGVAGVERYFDKRLESDPAPLRLSIDLRIQAVVREELQAGMDEFTAIGAAGIVMDVNTGELLAMVSLPDYDANDFGRAPEDDRFNRAVTGRYEPGSTFKLQTAAMALDSGAANIWNEFDASQDIHIGRFTISDYKGQHRWLYLPEVLAYSSNLGAAHIAEAVGGVRQRAWLAKMGMFQPVGVELPEAAKPLFPQPSRWSHVTTLTVGFGHGIAVTPLHVVRGTAVLANGGTMIRPTLLARGAPVQDDAEAGGGVVAATPVSAALGPDAVGAAPLADGDLAGGKDMPPEPVLAPPVVLNQPMMQRATSDIVRKLMRLVVTNGYGKPAEVLGYYVGGKTGTAEKVGAHGAYEKHANVSAFICVFPMNKPKYAVYMMLDDPHGNASTGFYSTAGAVSAPMAGKVIARIAPMLGMFPDTADADAINASLFIPMQPARPAGARAEVPPAPDVQAEDDRAPKRAATVALHERHHGATLIPLAAPVRRTAYFPGLADGRGFSPRTPDWGQRPAGSGGGAPGLVSDGEAADGPGR
jgi:cell division protein FtsI (penicillin-binding protein 3)